MMSGRMPSQCRSFWIWSAYSCFERAASVSSKRRVKRPLCFSANSQLNSAVRALPMWMWPVGDGAKRTVMVISGTSVAEAAVPLPVSGAVAEPVGDRIAAVAAKVLLGDLHARSRLPALVLGNIQQMLDAMDQLAVMAARDDVVDRHLALDEAFEDLVQHLVGRQRILVLLVRAEFR